MNSNVQDLINLFFKDLKQYNTTNFRTIKTADLSKDDPTIYKSFSAVVTRYFIFCERHPEISTEQLRVLYFKLRIDIIARYFCEYPVSNINDLKPFQSELIRFVSKDDKEDEDEFINSVAV